MVLAKIQRCGDAVYLRTFNALYECGTFADSGHRGRFRCFLRRSDIKQIYSACFATDEPPRVYRQCPLHSLFPDRCGHAHQYQSAVSGQSYSMGGVLHRLLRNPGQSHRSLYRLSGFPIATFFGSHDVRTHFGSCCRKYRHGDGGYASARSTGHLSCKR